MNSIEYYKLLRQRLGNRKHNDDLEDMVLTETAAMQAQLENGPTLPWFLLAPWKLKVEINGIVNMPTSFLGFPQGDMPVYWFRYSDGRSVPSVPQTVFFNPQITEGISEWAALELRNDDEVIANSGSNGTPRWYTKGNRKLYLNPRPEENYGGIGLKIYARQSAITSLVSAQTNSWLDHAPMTLLNLVGLQLAQFTFKDAERAQMFQAQFNAAQSQMVTDTIAYEAAGIDLNEREIPEPYHGS